MSPELDNPPAPVPMVGKAARTRSGKRFVLSRLQIAAWVLLVTMAAVQTWEVRHLIYSDGVSYLDIAGHYMRGDWRHALSDYWSPLFPWILAGVFKVFRTPAYWQTATLHAVNFGFFVLSLAVLELFVKELLRKQERTPLTGRHLSPTAIRVGAYCALMWAGLHLIGIGSVTPDMIAMALTFLTCYLLLRIDAGAARTGAYLALGVTLGLGFLDRAALLPMIPICLAVVLILLRRQRVPVWRPLVVIAAASAAVVLPFLVALAAVYGHFTLGTTGRLNYAFEVDGAARHIHWQGEPGDIGVPKHPTKKVLNHPATYTFLDDVPGAYPLWYRPSYWYEGVQPHLKLGPQFHIILAHSLFLSYLLLFSPLALPFLILAAFAGWRRWVSEGLAPYLFLLVPMLLSIGVYSLVFLERRYIAGHLVVIWLCLLAGVPVAERLRRRANIAVIAFILLFSFVAWVKWMARGTLEVAADAVRMHESVEHPVDARRPLPPRGRCAGRPHRLHRPIDRFRLGAHDRRQDRRRGSGGVGPLSANEPRHQSG
jgi:4-amino-4-deoxy-L-arabinose transferase-like glycosyltransferase